MPTERSKWESVTTITPEIRKKIDRVNQRQPIATVTLKIYSTRQGDSSAQVEMPSERALSQVGSVAQAYARLAAICQRELGGALSTLASAASDFNE